MGNQGYSSEATRIACEMIWRGDMATTRSPTSRPGRSAVRSSSGATGSTMGTGGDAASGTCAGFSLGETVDALKAQWKGVSAVELVEDSRARRGAK